MEWGFYLLLLSVLVFCFVLFSFYFDRLLKEKGLKMIKLNKTKYFFIRSGIVKDLKKKVSLGSFIYTLIIYFFLIIYLILSLVDAIILPGEFNTTIFVINLFTVIIISGISLIGFIFIFLINVNMIIRG